MDDMQEILIEMKKLELHNRILAEQIDIAIQGLEVITSMGGSIDKAVAEQTINAMKDCEKNNSSQDNNIDQ